MSAPNLLILDEPTNDLDVQTLAVLEEYLEDFNGCVIVVSHDRYFLDRTIDTIFAIEPDATIKQYPGNYSVYLDYKQAELNRVEASPDSKKAGNAAAAKSEPKAEKPPSKPPDSTKPRKLSYKEKRELEQLETQIPEWEAEKESLEKALYSNPPADFTEMQKLTERLAELQQTIESSTERWLELAELNS